MRSPLTRMKSAPCSSIALPVGGRPIIDPVLVPRITHCAATRSGAASPTLAIENETSGNAAKSPCM